MDITNRDAGPVNDPLYAKALVLTDGTTTAAIVTVDAVAIAEIGSIPNSYLANVRAKLQQSLKLDPKHLLINASHCHGIVRADIEARTVRAVEEAYRNLVPVNAGAGAGREDRIMENRRLKLKDGTDSDVRHAYSLPPDEEVTEAGPVDPEIGILRLDRKDGRPLAVIYNFACHPIQGVPSGGNTADIIGFASRTIEENLGEGATALFLQGCGGDINPIGYKDFDHPRNAEPLGNLLGLSALRAIRAIACKPVEHFAIRNETLPLPRADLAQRIAEREAEQLRLVQSLQGTTLNLKAFLPLAVKYGLSGETPSAPAAHYFREKAMDRHDLAKLDADNRANIKQYAANIITMERLTRLQTNLALLKKHQARNRASGSKTIDVEVAGLRVGDFRLVTFPGELTVRIGLNIKKRAPQPSTFVAGYTNGYIYYAPTEEQLKNAGGAQEDSDCLLGPGWQALFETRALDLLKGL
ncbi:MAG: hypothetical protein ABS79_06920 [Planctomycetes bacterium SCN 63-9]|nr:MAG: hypothetical protein ABS79_06920 [Planctomycetes bacterium SCN 63-9]